MENNEILENRQIRIFISSTFKDMREERAYLATKVFPHLRRYCEKRDVSIFELDLRWGITEEDAKQGKVFDICLREVIKTRPFFIGLLGERYGWVPSPEEQNIMRQSTPKIFEDFKWIEDEFAKGTSITEMEMQEGAIRQKEKINAYFYFRSSKMETPPEFIEEPGTKNAKKLKELKNTLWNQKDVYPVKEYDSIEQLGEQVERDFKELVDKLFPQGRLSLLEKERNEMRVFLKSKTRVYVPTQDSAKFAASIEKLLSNNEEKALVVTGESGIGKSTLIANWILTNEQVAINNEQLKNNLRIIYHFIGASQSEGDYHKILKRLIEEVHDVFNIQLKDEDAAFELNQDNENTGEKQTEELQNLLFSLPKDEKLIIVLEGADRLFETGKSKLLNWLPASSDNVKMVFSALPDDTTMEVFTRRGYMIFKMEPLAVESRERLIRDYLKNYTKTLTEAQVKRIAQDEKNGNPLVLLTLLDDLRVFGVFETLDEHIDGFIAACDYDSLFALVLKRAEEVLANNNTQSNFVRDILSFIAVSRNGLSETEILALAGIAPVYWSQLADSMSNHLTAINGLVTFGNRLIKSAVYKRYLHKTVKSGQNTIAFYRSRIASYMEREDVSFDRRCDEYPYQLFELRDWDKLYEFLLDYNVFLYIYKKDQFELTRCWQSLIETDRELFVMDPYLELEKIIKNKDEVILFYKSITSFLSLGLFEPLIFLKFALKNRDIHKELLGKEHEETAYAYDLAGAAYDNNSDYINALQYYKFALEIRKKIFSENHQNTALSYISIGIHLAKRYERQGALDYFINALNIILKTTGENNLITANIYKHMGNCYNYDANQTFILKEEKYPANREIALEYFKKSVKIYEELLGKNHLYTAQSYKEISGYYCDIKDYINALVYCKQAMNVCLKLLNKDDPTIRKTFNLIAGICININDYHQAIEYYEKEKKITEDVLGKDHTDAARCCKDIALCYANIKDYKKAAAFNNAALEIYNSKNTLDYSEKYSFEYTSDKTKIICGIYSELQKNYEALGDNEKADEYYNIAYKNYLELIKQDACLLSEIPEKYKTKELCLAALDGSGCGFSFFFEDIPDSVKTPELCKKAILKNAVLLKYIPEEMITEEICITAMKQRSGDNGFSHGYEAFEFVPERYKTKNVCLELEKSYIDAIKLGKLYLYEGFPYIPPDCNAQNICMEAVKYNPSDFEYIPEYIKTKDFCFIAVRDHGVSLACVPNDCKTIELCLEAVKKNGKNLEFVPEEKKNENICFEAVKQNGLALEFVPEKFKTRKLCLEAVNQNGKALSYAPETFKTKDICNKAVMKDWAALEFVPEHFKTEELCFEAVKQNGDALVFAPESMKTMELCNIALERNGNALRFTPLKFRTKELCFKALESKISLCEGFAFENFFDLIPKEIMNYQNCLTIVQMNGMMLKYIPLEHKTSELCFEAVKKDGAAIEFAPIELRTKEMCMEAVKKNGLLLREAPDYLITPEICLAAINQLDYNWISTLLEQMPRKFKTPEVCLAAVKKCGYALKNVPLRLRTAKLCQIAMHDCWALPSVPKEFLTQKVCLEAVKQEGEMLRYVPDEFKTPELCLEAAFQNPAAFQFVPEHLKDYVKKETGIE